MIVWSIEWYRDNKEDQISPNFGEKIENVLGILLTFRSHIKNWSE